MARAPAQGSDWLGSFGALGPVVAGLVIFHLLALFIWIILLIRGSRPARKAAGKQN